MDAEAELLFAETLRSLGGGGGLPMLDGANTIPSLNDEQQLIRQINPVVQTRYEELSRAFDQHDMTQVEEHLTSYQPFAADYLQLASEHLHTGLARYLLSRMMLEKQQQQRQMSSDNAEEEEEESDDDDQDDDDLCHCLGRAMEAAMKNHHINNHKTDDEEPMNIEGNEQQQEEPINKKRLVDHVKLLLEFHPGVKASNDHILVPALAVAAKHCHERVVRLLLEHDDCTPVVVNETDHQGQTALHHAVTQKLQFQSHLHQHNLVHDTGVLQALLEYGADPTIRDLLDEIPLTLAIKHRNGDAVRVLLQHNASNIQQQHNNGDSNNNNNNNSSAVLVPSGVVNLDAVYGKHGETALHRAARLWTPSPGLMGVQLDDGIVQALLTHGASPSILDNTGRTALEWATGEEELFGTLNTVFLLFKAMVLEGSITFQQTQQQERSF